MHQIFIDSKHTKEPQGARMQKAHSAFLLAPTYARVGGTYGNDDGADRVLSLSLLLGSARSAMTVSMTTKRTMTNNRATARARKIVKQIETLLGGPQE